MSAVLVVEVTTTERVPLDLKALITEWLSEPFDPDAGEEPDDFEWFCDWIENDKTDVLRPAAIGEEVRWDGCDIDEDEWRAELARQMRTPEIKGQRDIFGGEVE